MAEYSDVNEDSGVYYSGIYWNDYEVVEGRWNERISGDPDRDWFEHFAIQTGRTFTRALVLNCGNGWVERDLLDRGFIEEAVGTDYSQDLLEQAITAARSEGLPLTYHQANINKDPLPPGEFDLVINHAAAHHIATLDRVFREICRVLPQDGWFVHLDYVGPHRDQYRLDAWETLTALNGQLPESLRQTLTYPAVPVMLILDPTEAVHSELIVETFHRYFSEAQFTPLGGAIAYPLLTHNAQMWNTTDVKEQARCIDQILEADDQFLREHPESSLFAYFAGQPKKDVLQQRDLLDEWSAQEIQREQRARENGGEYYERNPLAVALIAIEAEKSSHAQSRELDALQSRYQCSEESHSRSQARVDQLEYELGALQSNYQVSLAQSQARVDQLENELDALQSSYLYSRVRRMVNSSAVRRVRANRYVTNLEHRLRG
jgi:SAM-dependent methyltransferase